jgi:hypothetical protein
MGTAQAILVVYAASSIAYGMLLGIPLTQIRMGAPSASHHLVVAHLSALIQGALYFGLAFGLTLSSLTPWINVAAAVLLVTGSALFVAGATANWRQSVGDHFAERSLGWKLLAASGGPHIVGAVIVLVGVVAGVLDE